MNIVKTVVGYVLIPFQWLLILAGIITAAPLTIAAAIFAFFGLVVILILLLGGIGGIIGTVVGGVLGLVFIALVALLAAACVLIVAGVVVCLLLLVGAVFIELTESLTGLRLFDIFSIAKNKAKAEEAARLDANTKRDPEELRPFPQVA